MKEMSSKIELPRITDGNFLIGKPFVGKDEVQMRRLFLVSFFAAPSLFAGITSSVAQDQVVPTQPMSAAAVNEADLGARFADPQRVYIVAPEGPTSDDAAPEVAATPDPAVARLQILLDQQGASPGVIDGFDGENLRKAVMGAQAMAGMPVTGIVDDALLALVETGQPAIDSYVIAATDLEDVTGPTPDDYAEKAVLGFLGYGSVQEALAERFHMDVDLLTALNPNAVFEPGESISVAVTGPDRTGEVQRIEADKALRQVRAYDAQGTLLVTYPATIGSEGTPSPSGSYVVEVVASMPNYTYNPDINFQQGENTEVLTIPPGPNGPVGSMWIALSKPTYGIHGTPEPSKIDKTSSYGCVRLTNWDAQELGSMVSQGVVVDFL
ncbi:Lipoprotein-anchoring transpeptidase ErfK/SrfK [Devosia psychrophila]|uniref:Lipoprotein-anchoring transpeptidase ErfK/SrfK n=2 Tax=Devosia psychrophila TaxID=728005 RepID=A0A1I1NSC1_9HYPH|nr:Lipoprotein-anchoring transpeptidase ErfK/SrfK [Devosia psychrophila]